MKQKLGENIEVWTGKDAARVVAFHNGEHQGHVVILWDTETFAPYAIALDEEEAITLAMVLLSAIPETLDAELVRFARFLYDEGCRIVRAPLNRLPPGSVANSEELIQRFIETSNVDWYKLAQDAERGKE